MSTWLIVLTTMAATFFVCMILLVIFLKWMAGESESAIKQIIDDLLS